MAGERAALVDEPRDRRRQHEQQGGAGDQQQVDLAHSVAERAPHAGGVAPDREAAERREQHGRNRDAEHALGQHVDPERVVDRSRRLV